jgi:rhombotail lipoprotein
LFQERVKESPEEFEVVHKPGYTGGGSLDAFFLFLIMMIGVSGVWLVKQQKK